MCIIKMYVQQHNIQEKMVHKKEGEIPKRMRIRVMYTDVFYAALYCITRTVFGKKNWNTILRHSCFALFIANW